jgi:hypothetical protein
MKDGSGMASKQTIDGRLAKLLIGEIDDLTAENQKLLLDMMERIFGVGNDDDVKRLVRLLRNNSTVSRIASKWLEGDVMGAEQVILGSKAGNGRA